MRQHYIGTGEPLEIGTSSGEGYINSGGQQTLGPSDLHLEHG